MYLLFYGSLPSYFQFYSNRGSQLWVLNIVFSLFAKFGNQTDHFLSPLVWLVKRQSSGLLSNIFSNIFVWFCSQVKLLHFIWVFTFDSITFITSVTFWITSRTYNSPSFFFTFLAEIQTVLVVGVNSKSYIFAFLFVQPIAVKENNVRYKTSERAKRSVIFLVSAPTLGNCFLILQLNS